MVNDWEWANEKGNGDKGNGENAIVNDWEQANEKADYKVCPSYFTIAKLRFAFSLFTPLMVLRTINGGAHAPAIPF